MPGGTVHLLVFDGYADWEPSYTLAELRRSGGREVTTVGYTRAPVVSMGGLRVIPDLALAQVRPERVALFILPGGDAWERAAPEPALRAVLEDLDQAGVPLAAICGGTVGVARMALLRGRRHTSNGLAYLRRMAPEYTEASGYVEQLAVRDRGLITASGLGAVEFAREIFAELGVLGEELEAWYRAFKYGEMPGQGGKR